MTGKKITPKITSKRSIKEQYEVLGDKVKEVVTIQDIVTLCAIEVIKGNMCRCYRPWAHKHGDRTPSLQLKIEKNTYYCHGCEVSGSVIDLFMNYGKEKLKFKPAMIALAERYNLYDYIPLSAFKSKAKLHKYLNADESLFHNKLRIEYYKSDGSRWLKKFTFNYINKQGVKIYKKPAGAIPYNLPALLKSEVIFVLEGEPLCDLLKELGLIGTTLHAGATTPWDKGYEEFFRNKIIIILPDNDKPGRKYARMWIKNLYGVAKSIKYVQLPGLGIGEDIINWLDKPGNTKEKLMKIVQDTKPYVLGDSIGDEEDDEAVVEAQGVVDSQRDGEEDPEGAEGAENGGGSSTGSGRSDEKNALLFPRKVFPFDSFPKPLRDIAENLGVSIGIESEAVLTMMLPCVGVTLGNKVKVEAKPGYQVSPFVWLLTIGDSGTGKSPAMDKLADSLKFRQAEEFRKQREQKDKYERAVSARNKDLKEDGEADIPLPEEPYMRCLVVTDTTVPSLCNDFRGSPQGFLLHIDEAGTLVYGFDKQAGGKGNDKEFYLTMFGGGAQHISRKTGDGSVFLPQTGASILAGTQNSELPFVFGTKCVRQGFLSRFIMYIVKGKIMEPNRTGFLPELEQLWKEILTEGYEIPTKMKDLGFIDPEILYLSDSAYNEYDKFFKEAHFHKEYLTDMGSPFPPKYVQYSLKIAGILHFLANLSFKGRRVAGSPALSTVNIISQETMVSAINLMKYYLGEAMFALKLYKTLSKKQDPIDKEILSCVLRLSETTDEIHISLDYLLEYVNKSLPAPLAILNNAQLGTILCKKLKFETLKRGKRKPRYLYLDPVKIKIHRNTRRPGYPATSESPESEENKPESTENLEVSPDEVETSYQEKTIAKNPVSGRDFSGMKPDNINHPDDDEDFPDDED